MLFLIGLGAAMDEADDNPRRGDGAVARPVPLSITESDLEELEVSEVEIPTASPPSETRTLLDALPALLDRGQRRWVLIGGLLGGFVAVGIASLFIMKLGVQASMSRAAAIEAGLIACAITAMFTCAGVAASPFHQKPIDDWLEKLRSSLR